MTARGLSGPTANRLLWQIALQTVAAGNLANGVWMLWSPHHWYSNLPGRVPDFGPMNEHFVRDMGCVFVMLGIVAMKGAYEKSWRRFALFLLQLWFTSHACIHLFDTFRGLVALEHLYLDLPLCYGPPVVVGLMQWVLHCEAQAEARAS